MLQAGLSSGMAATTGLNNSNRPPPVEAGFDGLAHVLPQNFVPEKSSRITLKGKKEDVKASYLCIGGWPWGDTATWNFREEERPSIRQAWETCLANGVTYIDTAQVYGSGESERICGALFQGLKREDFVIQTKWFMAPWSPTNILHPVDAPYRTLKESLERFRLDDIDVYLVHGHIHPQSISSVAKGLAKCVDEGLTKAVGVANCSADDLIKMKEELAKYDVPLALNQCEYNVLRRHPETDGLLKTCRDNNIIFQSYSSLAMGRLSAKYGPENEPPKQYRFSNYPMEEIEPTLNVLRDIAEQRGTSVSSVALSYNLSKGVIPVVGVRSVEQAEQNCKALGWRLNNEEIQRIDGVSFNGKKTILWQQG